MPRQSWKNEGHRLRVTRLVLGLTEQEAAAAAGVSVRTWRTYEAGRPPTNRRGGDYRFAERYDVSLDWLFDGEGSGLRNHLAKCAKGKVAILPCYGPRGRARLGAADLWAKILG